MLLRLLALHKGGDANIQGTYIDSGLKCWFIDTALEGAVKIWGEIARVETPPLPVQS